MTNFKETQYFSPIMKKIFSVVLPSLIVASAIGLYLKRHSSEEIIVPIIIVVAVLALALVLIWVTHLKINISDSQIRYQLVPIELFSRKIKKTDIAQLRIGSSNWFDSANIGKRIHVFSRSVSYVMNKDFDMLEIKLKNGKIRRLSIKDKTLLYPIIKEHYKEFISMK